MLYLLLIYVLSKQGKILANKARSAEVGHFAAIIPFPWDFVVTVPVDRFVENKSRTKCDELSFFWRVNCFIQIQGTKVGI